MKTNFTLIIAMLFCMLLPAFTRAQISGIVFIDYNTNGNREATASNTEPYIPGITVKAFNAAGVQIGGTKTTDANGAYSFTAVEITPGTPVRIEFSGLQTGRYTGFTGADNGSNIQFVSAPSVNINFALSNPDECAINPNPYVAVPTQINGTYNNAVSGLHTALNTFLYNANGNPMGGMLPTDNIPNTKALIAQTGALWGLAYQKKTKTLFAAAVVRRFAGLGPLGTGGIYKTSMLNPAANTGAVNFIDVQSIGINTGADPRGIDCDSIANSADWPASDIATADKVGKLGIGGIDYDDNTNTLWLINLTDAKLYGIQNINPTVTPVAADVRGGYTIALPSGYSVVNGILRPWAVKVHNGLIYVGAVADGSAHSDISNLTDLKGYVLKFDPSNTAAGFSVEYTFSFDMPHPYYGPNGGPGKWYNWQTANITTWGYWAKSPLISDIEFDIDGSLIMGIADRSGWQTGGKNYNDVDCNANNYETGGAQGDILRACKLSGGGYALSGQGGCTTVIPPAYLVDADGDPNAPNNYIQEYYWGDASPVPNNTGFNEGALGALAFLPGSGQVLSSSMDVENWHSNGVKTFNNTTGGWDNRYNIYFTDPFASNLLASHTFAKSSGLGDIEIIGDYQPIQIGNRIWLDANGNGIQDAGETTPGVPAGTTVTLRSPGADGIYLNADDQTWTTTTDAQGHYYFSTLSSNDNRKPAHWLGVNNAILPGYNYRIEVTLPINHTTTVTNAGSNNAIDNDAFSGANPFAMVNVNTDNNTHNYDIGLVNISILPDLNLKATVTLSSNNIATLNWTTESEINTKEFIIERSTDGKNFIPVGNVNAAGAANTVTAYNYKDDLFGFTAMVYYRIKVLSSTGKIFYSTVLAVNIVNAAAVTTGPNPFTKNITVNINAAAIQNITCSLLDARGATVKTVKTILVKGPNTIVIDGVSALPGGVYVIRLISERGAVVHSYKLIKQ